MVSYNELFKYYDYIFPIDHTTLTFLMNHIKSNNKILNASCGSGEYCIGLTRNNYDVTGIDFEENIINLAINKAKRLHLNIDFKSGNILSLNETFHGINFCSIFCIQNSLSYLNDLNEVQIVLKNFYNLLQARGTLILQFINYSRLFKNNPDEFSTIIKNKRAGFEFIKKYEIHANKIFLNSTLKSKDITLFDDTIKLLPINHKDLISILTHIGFKRINIFGDFTGCIFNEDRSKNLVFTCRK